MDQSKSELANAIEFYEKTIHAPEADRIAVGNDHIQWLLSAARQAVEDIRLMNMKNRLLLQQQKKLVETAGFVNRAWNHDRPHMMWSLAQLSKAVEATEDDCKY